MQAMNRACWDLVCISYNRTFTLVERRDMLYKHLLVVATTISAELTHPYLVSNATLSRLSAPNRTVWLEKPRRHRHHETGSRYPPHWRRCQRHYWASPGPEATGFFSSREIWSPVLAYLLMWRRRQKKNEPLELPALGTDLVCIVLSTMKQTERQYS